MADISRDGPCQWLKPRTRPPKTGKQKLYPSAAAALEGIVADGQTLAVGGFGLCGIPEALIAALVTAG